MILEKSMSILLPDKHSKPQYTTLYVAGILLKEIQNNGIIHFEELKERLAFLIDEKAVTLFTLALAFLFLMGKIEYVKELDSIKVVA